jgi:hypothetical protein
VGALLLAAAACGRRDEEMKKLDDVTSRLERIEKKLDSPRLPARPQLPQEPDTKTVYAVPIDGDPFVGPETAKVTLVEASDFA